MIIMHESRRCPEVGNHQGREENHGMAWLGHGMAASRT